MKKLTRWLIGQFCQYSIKNICTTDIVNSKPESTPKKNRTSQFDPPSEERWFILAHCFNMDGRAASQTITDRLPFLIEKGKIPVVLSAPTGFKDRRFPHYQIISPAPSGLRFEFRHIITRHFQNPFLQKILKALSAILLFPFYLLEKLFIHLDSQWSWFITATIYGFFIIKKHHPSIIYSTAGPPSTHLTGHLLHLITGLPWIAELHDPLIYNNERYKWQNYFFKKWLEKVICNNASRVVFFNHKAHKNASRRCLLQDKGVVVRPGAFPPGFQKTQYKKQKKFHLAHFGSLCGERNLAVPIQALYELIQENSLLKNSITFDIFGSNLDAVSAIFLSQYPLDNIIELHGRLEFDSSTNRSGRQMVLEVMQQTDVLLLIHGENIAAEEYIPSKIYEYFLANRPILGLVAKDSELEHMLLETGHHTVKTSDVSNLKDILLTLIGQWERNDLSVYYTQSVFNIEKTVDQLIDIVEQAKNLEGN